MNMPYKDFPPGWRHLKVPMADRRTALASLTLYAACRPRGRWVQRAAMAGVALLGPKVLPGAAKPWVPLDPALWNSLHSRWRSELGSFDAVAGYERTLASRSGLAVLLLKRGEPLAFVKLRPRSDREFPLEREAEALGLVSASRPKTFVVPELLSTGVVDEWCYCAMSALPARLHRAPSDPPLDAIVEEVEAGLAKLPRPDGLPVHWRRMHGDLTPWNLRECDRQRFLIDWEHAGWGPPYADVVGYRLAAAALGIDTRSHRWSPTAECTEAIRYWAERSGQRSDAGSRRDDRHAVSVRRVLHAFASEAGMVAALPDHQPLAAGAAPDSATRNEGMRG